MGAEVVESGMRSVGVKSWLYLRQLCDLQQAVDLLLGSVFSSVKWEATLAPTSYRK